MGSREVSLVDLARAVGDGWCAFVRGAVRGEALLVPGGSLGIGGEPFPDMNFGYVYGPEGVGAAMRRFDRSLRERGLPGSIAVLSPAAEEAAGAAARLGLVDGGSAPFMCVHSGDAQHVEHEYAVECVSDTGGVMDAAEVLGDAYEIPPEWIRSMVGPGFPDLPNADLFLARRDGRALAAAGTGRTGPTAGLYAVGTRMAHRRRGAAAAAVSGALDYHVRTGARLFGLLSDPDAEALYASLGFAVVDHARIWRVEGP
ncbi:MAG TPA: GNAT family N-acetyltransferase [Thermoleophilia bacterium]